MGIAQGSGSIDSLITTIYLEVKINVSRNRIIMHIILTVWGMKGQDCAVSVWPLIFLFPAPGSPGEVSFSPFAQAPRVSASGMKRGPPPHLVVFLTTPPTASHRTHEVGEASESFGGISRSKDMGSEPIRLWTSGHYRLISHSTSPPILFSWTKCLF